MWWTRDLVFILCHRFGSFRLSSRRGTEEGTTSVEWNTSKWRGFSVNSPVCWVVFLRFTLCSRLPVCRRPFDFQDSDPLQRTGCPPWCAHSIRHRWRGKDVHLRRFASRKRRCYQRSSEVCGNKQWVVCLHGGVADIERLQQGTLQLSFF